MRRPAGLLPIAMLSFVSLVNACAVDADPDEGGEGAGPRTNAEALAGTTKKQLQYFVTAHPDDELASWSLVEKSRDNYPVFIVLTEGERTAYCEPGGERHWQPELGEARPGTRLPYAGRGTRACRDARIGSWHRFLDAMSDGDSQLSRAPRFRGTFASRVGSYRVWADARSARVAFDLGDGALTSDEVTAAIQAVRARRGDLFPIAREYGVVAASYSNLRADIGCDVYDHPDHRAVHVAIFTTDQGTAGPQWGRTCVNDPDVARTGGRVEDVDSDTFDRAMGVDAPAIDPARHPSARRRGAFQVHYGWLRPAFWEGVGRDGRTHFDRRQAFWKRF